MCCMLVLDCVITPLTFNANKYLQCMHWGCLTRFFLTSKQYIPKIYTQNTSMDVIQWTLSQCRLTPWVFSINTQNIFSQHIISAHILTKWSPFHSPHNFKVLKCRFYNHISQHGFRRLMPWCCRLAPTPNHPCTCCWERRRWRRRSSSPPSAASTWPSVSTWVSVLAGHYSVSTWVSMLAGHYSVTLTVDVSVFAHQNVAEILGRRFANIGSWSYLSCVITCHHYRCNYLIKNIFFFKLIKMFNFFVNSSLVLMSLSTIFIIKTKIDHCRCRYW